MDVVAQQVTKANMDQMDAFKDTMTIGKGNVQTAYNELLKK